MGPKNTRECGAKSGRVQNVPTGDPALPDGHPHSTSCTKRLCTLALNDATWSAASQDPLVARRLQNKNQWPWRSGAGGVEGRDAPAGRGPEPGALGHARRAALTWQTCSFFAAAPRSDFLEETDTSVCASSALSHGDSRGSSPGPSEACGGGGGGQFTSRRAGGGHAAADSCARTRPTRARALCHCLSSVQRPQLLGSRSSAAGFILLTTRHGYAARGTRRDTPSTCLRREATS